VGVERRDAGQTACLVDWTHTADVVPGADKEPARNVLRVDVESDIARFVVNGKIVAEVRRPTPRSHATAGDASDRHRRRRENERGRRAVVSHILELSASRTRRHRPVVKPQIADPREFGRVVGHEREAKRTGVGGNE